MGSPKVSIIWLNHNSMHIIDLVFRSLQAVHELDYPHYELIVVDNASTDGSFEVIRKFVERKFGSSARIVRLEKNLGFCGGVNAGFKARDPDSKYVVLLNNDAIPEPDSLRNLVEVMEQHPNLGAAQGVIINLGSGLIDTAGGYMSRYLFGAPYLRGEAPTSMRRAVYVSYADGAYSIWRVSAVLKANKSNKMFYDELFAYCDDNVLGLRLWTVGYKVASFPFVAARHARGSTFKKKRPLQVYLSTRCCSFLCHLANVEWKTKALVKLVLMRRMLTVPLLLRAPELPKLYLRAWRDGKRLALKIAKEGISLDLRRAPLLKLGAADIVKLFVAARYLKVDKTYVERNYAVEA